MGLVELGDFRREPPMEWFTAFGDTDTGISHVTVNETFFGLGDGQAGHYYVAWREQMRIFNLPGNRSGTIKKAGKAILKAEALFSKATGFSPQDISAMARKLSEQYRGKKEAPIDTRLLR
ncbi:MAG: hypothetical protein UX52_C0018G0002 [Candidatus Amesbacteria bacterium GW2011_GWA1_46_35]|uniref:Uncharacterized protein n=1 Tax=Candidatus Amesbacteria bacterium GW2011_GWC2_45_19 TaxID=1618366 RepID=A0A0G1M583_9BACT|nr:MAG: hypothetical protein UX05_C0001G0048 [Candidatus Amesbacteria bacterium GW2011_GWC2_45_19]KKU37765.1 MAG: hypothetical protein UX52_C0018G0002 [Candidatus Amesbacteria bacterium GW2011_GWA1_46_35]KKU69599.1 MAG: hypothetical protein UX93_C0001G0184 [Microgenomates group bacterium GW2011_GWC1_47_20]